MTLDSDLSDEVAALESDEVDRQEIRRVAELMEELRESEGDAKPTA